MIRRVLQLPKICYSGWEWTLQMFILYQLHLVDVAVSFDIHHRQRRPDGEIPANR